MSVSGVDQNGPVGLRIFCMFSKDGSVFVTAVVFIALGYSGGL